MYLKLRRPKARQKYEPQVAWCAERKWRLAVPFSIGDFEVPAGFVTDGASIPRFLWWWHDPDGVAFPAAIIHDWLYRTQPVKRDEADVVFFCDLLLTGVRPTLAFIMWCAVRVFGGHAWRNDGRDARL